MTEEEKYAEIARLKDQALAAKARIDEVVQSGDFELSEAMRRKIIIESQRQLALKDSNQVLKEMGVSRATRRKLNHMKKRGPQTVPSHTARAMRVAQKAKAA